MKTHVIFIHGLSGHHTKTWVVKRTNPPLLWPKWLSEDIPGIGLWFVNYPANMSNWFGHSQPLSDRADNILALLLAESRLKQGNIIFIVHSLGGLVVEQLLRNAERDSSANRDVEEFISRVRRIGFLGTPHHGAIHANFGKALKLLLLRPSQTIHELVLGNPTLRDLNFWYRKYSQKNNIDNLVLAEGRPGKILGLSLPRFIGNIVTVNSADPGLPEFPIIVDESHGSICKPNNQENEVYVHLKNFISRPFTSFSQVTLIGEALDKNTLQIEELVASNHAQQEAIKGLTRMVELDKSVSSIDTKIIDAEVLKQLSRLKKVRLFGSFDTLIEARKLLAKLNGGGLSLASSVVKDEALAWCARFLSVSAPDEAETALESLSFNFNELTLIARGLIIAGRGNLDEALKELTRINTSQGYGAAYISIIRAKDFRKSRQWLQDARLSFLDLDSDAKFFFLRGALESGEWLSAYEAVLSISESDFERSPGLILAAADIYLVQAVPDELRMSVLQYLPFDAANFPLRGDTESLVIRRTAVEFYKRLYVVATEFDLYSVAGYADDMRLWLQLKDPQTTAEAKHDLALSIKEPLTLLRRINLALQFGIEIDLQQVENEVDRQTALSGGTSYEAAVARLALAFTQGSKAAAAAYVEKHRKQLLDKLEWKSVYFFEIEMLASSDQISQAEVRIQEATTLGLTQDEIAFLRHHLAEASGSDPISERLAIYEHTKSLTDLHRLVDAYDKANNWKKLVEYGGLLLELTGDIAHAHQYAIALYNEEQLDEVIELFETYPALIEQYDQLYLLKVRTMFEMGDLFNARESLQLLRDKCDSADARLLEINITIASGDWESLQLFVESEWQNRKERTALELIRAGQIAQQIGAVRGRDLVQEAALLAHDDANLLVNCYLLATSAGWEANSKVHQWLDQAESISVKNDNNGPVRRVTFDELIEQTPGWEKRRNDTLDSLVRGELPMFSAATLLNQSLLNLFLWTALSNLEISDVRKRSLVYGFSGARNQLSTDPQIIAIDPTALMTAEFLGLLEYYFEAFERIVIPHNTLSWLMNEKARILFHQPSRVLAAHELKRLISQGYLHPLEGIVTVPENLAHEVGEGLASLIAEASFPNHPITNQRLVVRGGPVHKASTFMKEDANLEEYEDYLCSSSDIVEKLAKKGVLEAHEAEEARAALKLREIPWASSPEIADDAIIYLDDVAFSHLEFLGLLPKLHRANLKAVVSQSKIEEADALILLDAQSTDVIAIVEKIRANVRKGIETGKIRLANFIRFDNKIKHQDIMTHPTAAILKIVNEVEACVVDDRFFNKFDWMSTDTVNKPMLVTFDILNILERKGLISSQRKQVARTRLRLANFALLPLDYLELKELISLSTVQDSILIETTELRAVRENILRIRMSHTLQLPTEFIWLNQIVSTCLRLIRDQWFEGFVESIAVARSNWLAELCDISKWTHRISENEQQQKEQYSLWVSQLMVLTVGQPDSVMTAYWRWLESRILSFLVEEDPETYALLLEHAKEQIAKGVEFLEKDLESL